MLTTYAGDVQVVRAFKAGARGYLLKGNVHSDLLETIRAVYAGKNRVPPEVATGLAIQMLVPGKSTLKPARCVTVLGKVANPGHKLSK